MKKYIVFIGILVVTFSCSTKKMGVINPNGSSELALVMEKMYEDMFRMKKEIQKGKTIKNVPNYPTLLTATPTDESMRNNTFEPFAKGFIMNLDELRQAPKNEQKDAYDVVVQTCISCHNNSCPGPLMRIKNLVLD